MSGVIDDLREKGIDVFDLTLQVLQENAVKHGQPARDPLRRVIFSRLLEKRDGVDVRLHVACIDETKHQVEVVPEEDLLPASLRGPSMRRISCWEVDADLEIA